MRPASGTRVWRKGLRRARRGMPTGRRATHPVVTAYGRGQAHRDWLALWNQPVQGNHHTTEKDTMPTQEMILADRYRDGEEVDPMEADDAALADGRRTAWHLIHETA